jgi:hypothetical protein
MLGWAAEPATCWPRAPPPRRSLRRGSRRRRYMRARHPLLLAHRRWVVERHLVRDFALDISIFRSATTKFSKLGANFNFM